MASREPSAAAPATAPMVVNSMRRERGSSAIAEPPLENDRGSRVASARGATVAEGRRDRQRWRGKATPLVLAGAAGLRGTEAAGRAASTPLDNIRHGSHTLAANR